MLTSAKAIQYYSTHPVEFVQDIIQATPDQQQARILNSVANNQLTSVRSGHGIGKSTVEAWTVIWFMCTRPFPKIPCTAPTQHQLFDILWAEISKWLRNNKALENDLVWTKEKFYMKSHPEEWFAVARTASKPDALQGFHAEEVLYIIDEASGVEDKIFEPVLGALSTAGARLLMCGNPTKTSGFFYDSHTKNKDVYSTFAIDGRNSPRVSKEFVDTIIRMYGEDSDVFRVRVAGEFPKSEADVFIPISLCYDAANSEPGSHEKPVRITVGVDVARYGDDDTVLATNVDCDIISITNRHGQSLDTTVDDIVEQYKFLVRAYPRYHGQIFIVIDDTGLGGGVTDFLRREKRKQNLKRMTIIPVNFGSKVPDKAAAKHYDDIVSWMWGNIRELARAGELHIPNDTELIGQLCSRKYHMAGTPPKIKLESKEMLKKRGLSSPDRADAVALSLYNTGVFDIKTLTK